MKSYSTTKSVLLTFFLIVTLMVACFAFAACSMGDASELKNNSGFVVKGGDFPKDATLETEAVALDSTEGKQVLSAISGQSYDESQPVYVFDLSIVSDGVKVQPSGKVKVTIPVTQNLSGYDVLHIKSNGSIERLSATYSQGKITFETSSFSKFVLVKKITPADGSGSSSGDGTSAGGGAASGSTFTLYSVARTIIPSRSDGGTVRNSSDTDITYDTQNIAQNSQYTVKAHCYPDYSFLGWYEASDFDEATQDTLLSKDETYTFTLSKNLNILALYAHKDDVVELVLDAKSYGFSYRNGQPTTTLVAKGSADTPDPDDVEVKGLKANGFTIDAKSQVNIDKGGLDFTKAGTYTITYSHKNNPNIKAELKIQVVEGGHILSVSTADKLYFLYNGVYNDDSFEALIPEGKLITLQTRANDPYGQGYGYSFKGWYNAGDDSFVSKDLVYCFAMPAHDVSLYGKYEQSSVSLTVDIGYFEGGLIDAFGNTYHESGAIKRFYQVGEEVSFAVQERSSYDFLGWYKYNPTTNSYDELLESERTINLTISEAMEIKARFNEKFESLEVDSDTLAKAGFVNGKLVYTIGDDAVDYENFAVSGVGKSTGNSTSLAAIDYTIDNGSVNFNAAGTYTITYSYKHDVNVAAAILTIVVINPLEVQIEFNNSHSYLDHWYNGKAAFISLRDVTVNGVALYDFPKKSKIWEKITYAWTDKNTGAKVDTQDVDVTINGTTIGNFGPTNGKFTVGNEFCGPVQAGQYRFELKYDGTTAFTQDATITTLAYKKISSKDEFKTNEGSICINFYLYYYTIVGYADGDYYIMQMPDIGADNVEVEARKATLDTDGNLIIGEGNDFAFVNAKYYANQSTNYTEFLTGYYGSYVDYSSASSTVGEFGSPYIYRTGYTSVSGGKIYRQYGNKSSYGNSTEFDSESGAVTIYCPNRSETANTRLRLVKDGDKYVFTSVAADTDTRDSYEVFIYQSTQTSR